MSNFLDPVKSRQHLLDMVKPPQGYKLEAAIGTTYSLELPVLLTLLIEMAGQVQDESDDETNEANMLEAGSDSANTAAFTPVPIGRQESDDETGTSDPNLSTKASRKGLSALLAVKKLAGRVKVLVHRSGIKTMRKMNSVTSILDQFIVEVPVPKGSSFHPKVWVLAYKHKEKEELFHRLICMSRNLSSAKQHEIGLILEEPVGRKGGHVLPELGRFLQRLLPDGNGPTSELIHRLANANVRFLSPVDGWKPSFIFQYPGCPIPLKEHLPKYAGKTLVISPFVTEDFVVHLEDTYGAQKGGTVTLISMSNELRKLENVYKNKGVTSANVYALDQVNLDGREEDGMIHAKIVMHQSAKGNELFIGSANWTGRAWRGRNWEAMVKLVSTAHDANLQIDALVGTLLQIGASPFTLVELTETERDRIQAEKKASDWISQIARLTFEGKWRVKDEEPGIELMLKIRGDTTGMSSISGTFRPFPNGKVYPIAELETSREITFDISNELDRTKFLEFEVHTSVGTAEITKKCLMLMSIPETLEQQERRIDLVIASYLEDPDKFWDALMHILTDELFGEGGGSSKTQPSDMEHNGEADTFPFEELTLELLLKACYGDEDKVKAIHSVVAGAKAAPDREQHPAWSRITSFIALWDLIVEAREGIVHGTKAVSTKIRGLDHETTVSKGRRKRSEKGASSR